MNAKFISGVPRQIKLYNTKILNLVQVKKPLNL